MSILNFKSLVVLVVEDSGPLRELIGAVLKTLDVGTILTASNAEHGLKLYLDRAPDIALIDWELGDKDRMSGIGLTQEIRKNPLSLNRVMPIILLTGYSAENRVQEARDAGATEFMTKPFTASNLAKRLSHVINKPRDFIDCQGYFGPDRRRNRNLEYSGPLRRSQENT